MSKPYLSVIFPDPDNLELLTLSMIRIDEALQNAGFDYEIFVSGCGRNASAALAKLNSFVRNLKYECSPCISYGEKLKSGIRSSTGNVKVIARMGNYDYLKNFEQFLPSLKDSDFVMGFPSAEKGAFSRFKYFIGGKLAQYDFLAFKEESANLIFPSLISKTEAIRLEAISCAGRNNSTAAFISYPSSNLNEATIDILSLQYAREIVKIYLSNWVQKVFEKINNSYNLVKSKRF